MPPMMAPLAPVSETAGFWIFGYGSLMWRPGFTFCERTIAVIRGYHRSLCVYSHVHRGTPKRPGLVLGLDRGGSCRGIAYRVAEADRTPTLVYLRAREQATSVYLERSTTAVLADGRHVIALTYVADRQHPQYAGKLSRPDLLRLVRQGEGVSGANPDYVRNTHEHLVELGFVDDTLAWLAAHLS
jgi:cation transport protein ChaC